MTKVLEIVSSNSEKEFKEKIEKLINDEKKWEIVGCNTIIESNQIKFYGFLTKNKELPEPTYDKIDEV